MALSAVAARLQPWSGSSTPVCAAVFCCRGLMNSRTVLESAEPKHAEILRETTQQAAQPEAAASQAPSSSGSSSTLLRELDAYGYELVYQGYFSKPHKRLKYASLLNTFASFAAAPLILQYSAASPVARVAVTTSVVAFALITTGGLHWFTQPYVHQLWFSQQQQAVKVQTMSLFGGLKWKQFPLSSVSEFGGIHPLANFKAEGNKFYVDRQIFQDPQLLQRLMPWTAEQQAEADTVQGSEAARQ